MTTMAVLGLALLHPHSVALGSEALFLLIGFTLGFVAGLAVRTARASR